MSSNCEWSILEKLLLTQAVYKYGENMWFQVARVLKQHGLIQPQQRQSDFFSQKNCQFQYYLLVENLEAEKQVYRNNELKNDMPVVVRIARQLYLQRIEQVKDELKKDEADFGELAEEINSIKSGKWDQKLKEPESGPSVTEENKMLNHIIQQENCIKRTSSETTIVTTSSLKRCRLEEEMYNSNEDQVISTAILNPLVETPVNNPMLTKEPDVDSFEEGSSIAIIPEVPFTKDANIINDIDTFYEPTEIFQMISSNPLIEILQTEIKTQDIQYAPMGNMDEKMSSPSVALEECMQQENRQKDQKADKLPRIIIPEASTSYHRSYQSASPISKLHPDDEYFTSSETATPTSARRFPNNDQRQKAWQKNINLLWQEIANHKNGTMFMNPIKKSYAPLYDKVVKQPLYLKTIKNRVRDGVVKTTAEFERDVVLMLTNSLMYNKEGTEMYLMALEMLDDVREQIRLFKSADGYSVSLWENDSQQ